MGRENAGHPHPESNLSVLENKGSPLHVHARLERAVVGVAERGLGGVFPHDAVLLFGECAAQCIVWRRGVAGGADERGGLLARVADQQGLGRRGFGRQGAGTALAL